ncbi:unnamed protein product [Spirodela intermedia]|uniref:Uncharacterized protein n=1 Tax=Spirodela intermedia TaxID=51605 RepID=A0A7I8JBR7_SPIIN|nr:unnamed protein product [Spirodela intermedia]CAA6667648.1 unnamed protein product [Spirodela intermedia]
MPATDYQGSSVPFASLGRSILSIRREQAHSMDTHHDDAGGGAAAAAAHELELESFQRHVAELFQDLASAGGSSAGSSAGGGEELLSLSWIRRLLEAFLVCQEEFKAILMNHRGVLSRSPLDRLVAEFFERSVKALDVCNAIRDGLEQIRQWHKHLEIVQGQLRRAKKALTDLTIAMLDEKEAGSVVAHRNRSFGRINTSTKDHHRLAVGHSRSLSWSVSRSWSAARQLQGIGNNLAAPRSHEIDRGLQTHFSVPRNFSWAASMTSLHERILEESKKRDRRNSSGLLKEIQGIERCSRHLAELADPSQFPLGEEREMELRQRLQELSQVCDSLKNGLDPLERHVRDVFHRIVRSRTDGLDWLGHSGT